MKYIAYVYPVVILHAVVNELVSHLPLQMLLYFNLFYFPCWWFSAVFMLEVKASWVVGKQY